MLPGLVSTISAILVGLLLGSLFPGLLGG